MATDFIMPRLPDQHQMASLYSHQSAAAFYPRNYPQISPLSTSNSNNTSPTSPKSHYTRQVRPLYMPAVLRPTEHPPKLPTARSRPDSECLDDRPNSAYLGIAGLGALGRLRRRSTDDGRRSVDDCNECWKDLDIFPKVTGLPPRHHWKPDASSTICDEPTCKRYFSYFTRRHHCRRCGNIFCDIHSAHDIPLDQDLNFNPRATPSRSCSHCYSQYNAWRSRTNSQASSAVSSEANLAVLASGGLPYQNNTDTASSSPIAASPAAINTPVHPLTSPDAAASVPRDWNWSTF